MTQDIATDSEQADEEQRKKDSANNALQQAEALLKAARTVEEIEQVRELFRWIHQGI